MAIQPFTEGPFQGVNLDENPLSLGPGELRDVLNLARYGSMVGTRPGTARPGSGEDYENALTGTPAIRGACEYRKNFDENRALIVVAANPGAGTYPNSKLWYQDDARLSDAVTPAISTSQDYITTMVLHNNLLWGTTGPPGKSQATTEDIFTWDGDSTTPSAPVIQTLTDKASGVNLRPKFLYSWRGYLLMTALQQATPTFANNPITARYCEFSTDATVDANWQDANTIGFSTTAGAFSRSGVGAYGGNFATGFGEYQDNEGDYLILLSNHALAAVRRNPAPASAADDFLTPDNIANGCVHQRAFVNLGLDAGDAIYMSDRPAFHTLRQSQEHGLRANSFISYKIQPFMRTLNRSRIHYSCGAYDSARGRVVFAVTTGSNTGHDVLVVLDVADQREITWETARWSFWQLASGTDRLNHLMFAKDANNREHLYGFTVAGDVIRFTEDIYSDYGNRVYGFRMRTADRSFGSLHFAKGIQDIRVTLQSLGRVNASMRVVFDMGRRYSDQRTLSLLDPGSTTWGGSTWGGGTWSADSIQHVDEVFGEGSGETIGFEISHFGLDEPVRVGQIDYLVEMSGETHDASEGT